MRRLLLLALLPLSGCTGLVYNADHHGSADAGQTVGAHICRIEFNASAPASSLDGDVDYMMDRGCRPILLAGFANQNTPTQAEAQNVGTWAARFGPGSPFMAGRNSSLAVGDIEFGNESSYRNGIVRDDWWNDPSYVNRACNYGQKAQAAVFAVAGGNRDVHVIVQADHGGSGSASWVNNMLACGPSLKTETGGWSVHPYGPNPASKINAVLSQTAAAGASSSIPVDITEYGIATDNGANLTDNYGWPTNLTYQQAADALNLGIQRIKDAAGSRLRWLMIYSAHDLQPSGTGQREHYFGCLKNTNAAKGAYTTACRDQLAN